MDETRTLNDYCRLPLKPFTNFERTGTNVEPCDKHYQAAKTLYEKRYKCSIPEFYQVRPNLVSTAYDQLYKKFKAKLDAKPVSATPFYASGSYANRQGTVDQHTNLHEPNVKFTVSLSVIEPAVAVANVLGQSIVAPKTFPALGSGFEEGLKIPGVRRSKTDHMIWHYSEPRNYLLATEVKALTKEPTIVNKIKFWEGRPPRRVAYTVGGDGPKDLTELAIGKMIVNMILNDVETGVFTDYHNWVFVHLPRPKNNKEAMFSLSKVYRLGIEKVDVIGTVVALIVHSHPNLEFQLDFH